MNELELKDTLTLLYSADDKKLLKEMTDFEWQEKYVVLKTIVKPSKERKLTRKCGSVRVVNRNWSLSCSGYGDGIDTLDSRYCAYINDVLKVIRTKGKKPKKDCCYHIYQVAELLRFEPELVTKLVHDCNNTYFDVWLNENH